ncbi:Lipase [Paramyrothecium foliicola]|nr:Lipase [Paramyrothecium foliicola]
MSASNGLASLSNLAHEVEKIVSTNDVDKKTPLVFVPGFSGWGTPLFGAINYFGGVIDIPNLLAEMGYTVIVAPIAPISTNWERACELYSQLTFGRFSAFNPGLNTIEEFYDVNVNYGTYFAGAHGPQETSTRNRRRAILFTKSTEFKDWKWNERNKVHFICHSQGGNTVRYLISLMANGAGGNHPEFTIKHRDNWAISVTTLGTPHRGTTIIDAIERALTHTQEDTVGLVARLFATASYYPPSKRAYDLQLDHWGIRREGNETFQAMLTRLERDDGPVARWLFSNNNGHFFSKNNGLYDNSIEGVNDLSRKTMHASNNVYYFSLSFHSTEPFPEEWPTWVRGSIDTFPLNFETVVRERLGSIPIAGSILDMLIAALTGGGWVFLTTMINFRSFVAWVTESVLTTVLRQFGYDIVLPNPGNFVPRRDVMPLLLPSVYAMGSQGLTEAQREILGPNLGDWYQNDGVVNTESMDGPHDSVVRSINDFSEFVQGISEKRGIYWHLGVNSEMDHADEIGVFMNSDTGAHMREMYVNIAKLVSRLPASRANEALVLQPHI